METPTRPQATPTSLHVCLPVSCICHSVGFLTYLHCFLVKNCTKQKGCIVSQHSEMAPYDSEPNPMVSERKRLYDATSYNVLSLSPWCGCQGGEAEAQIFSDVDCLNSHVALINLN